MSQKLKPILVADDCECVKTGECTCELDTCTCLCECMGCSIEIVSDCACGGNCGCGRIDQDNNFDHRIDDGMIIGETVTK